MNYPRLQNSADGMETTKSPIRKMALLGILSALLSSPIMAQVDTPVSAWACSNLDVEITCDAVGCQAADSFTPMSVSLSTEEISVCAYSGCWQGAPISAHWAGKRFQSFTAESLPFSTAPDTGADIAITIDTQTGVATLLVAEIFAHPMRCQKPLGEVQHESDD